MGTYPANIKKYRDLPSKHKKVWGLTQQKKKLQVFMLKNIIKLLKKLFEIQKYRQKF